MRGLTKDERRMMGMALPGSGGGEIGTNLLHVVLGLQRSGRLYDVCGMAFYATDMGRLAMRVCPPEES